MDNQKQHYLLSIDKKQIFFISLVFSLTLALFFLIGLNFGEKFSTTQKENYINKPEDVSDFMRNRVDEEYSVGGKQDSDLAKDLEKTSKKDVEKELSDVEDKARAGIVFENYLDSEKLLEQENLRLSGEKSKKIIGTVAPFPKKGYENSVEQEVSPAVERKVIEQSGQSKKLTAYETKPLPGVDYFFIQIIATEDLAKAKRIASQLTSKKYLAVVHKSLMGAGASKKEVYLVRIGLYKDKEIAKLHLKEIASLGVFSDAFVARYREQS